jgi:nitroreductase
LASGVFSVSSLFGQQYQGRNMNSDDNKGIENSVLEFMQKRRSVPAKLMTGPGPDEQQLNKILEISCRVPDHGKLTPWRIIRYGEKKCVILGEKILARAREIARLEARELTADEAEIEAKRFLRTPVVMCITSNARAHPKIPEGEQVLSSGAVAMNMLIAANASGFDAQWLTEWYSYDESLSGEFGLNENEKVAGFMHIGTRRFPKTERDRPKIEDIYSIIES